jgi:CO/xanthine dehydrogenase Mo-binding subunit
VSHRATYELPYLAHAAMEPSNAARRMRADGVLDVWAGTESPEYARTSASEAAGIDKDRVVQFAGMHISGTPLGHLARATISAACKIAGLAGLPQWACQDLNLDLTDYESAALTD